MGAILLEELGVRDLFEGRQEPLSWHFRGLAYDQSELDILESGAVETLHAPSALVELVVDEMALACANLGREGVAAYLQMEEEDRAPGPPEPDDFRFHPEAVLGYLTVDAAPPARWLEEREPDPRANERLASRLSEVAQELGSEAANVEVHIEGAVDASGGWTEMDVPSRIRPAGVSLYFSFDIPLEGVGERRLARIFADGARVASGSLERMRGVFRGV